MSNDKKVTWQRQLVIPLLGFGVLCLLTAFVLSFIASDELLVQKVPATGGIVGPFTITDDGTVLDVEVSQALPLQTWSDVSVGLLDARKQWLIGFGGEFWHESGYDGGRWEEADSEYHASLTIPDDGRYYLQVKPQNNLRASAPGNHAITVRANTRGFSTIPHFAVGIVAIVLGLLLSFISGGGIFAALKES